MRELLTVSKAGICDQRLRQKSVVVENIDGYIKELAREMQENLKMLGAVGFSAPQFGELVQLFVIDFQGVEIVMINPEIVKATNTHWICEGCKSIPGRFYYVKRPKLVKIRGLGLDGEPKGVKAHDLLAACLCHEIDHLEGTLIDEIGKLRT